MRLMGMRLLYSTMKVRKERRKEPSEPWEEARKYQ